MCISSRCNFPAWSEPSLNAIGEIPPPSEPAMLIIFESLLPIFLLVVLGQLLRKANLVPEESWPGMERISYFVFFPALLFMTIYKADFSRLAAAEATAGFLSGTAIMLALMLAVRKPMQSALQLSSASYSSVYQATTRWNGFIILAIAERLMGAPGLAIVAIGLGTMVGPINVVNIAAVTAWGEREGPRPSLARQILTNPLIFAVVLGLASNLLGVSFYKPLETTFDLIARISLPLGLILVGAGLRIRLPNRALIAAVIATFVKLAVMPAILAACAWWFGVRGDELMIVALCGAGPAAMNGYVVARELGGDAPLFAVIVTMQTAASFFTIPIVIALLS